MQTMEVYMGKICFNADAYNIALTYMSTMGFANSHNERVDLEGKYICVEKNADLFIESSEYSGARSKAPRIINTVSLPTGVKMLLGRDEITPENSFFMIALEMFYQCFDSSFAERSRGECVKDVKNSIEAEARQRERDLMERGKLLIKLADEQDEYPFGIDKDPLKKIYDWFATSHYWNLRSLVQREQFAEGVISQMLRDDSGYQTVKERSADSGCTVTSFNDDLDEIACPDLGISTFYSK